MGRAISFEPAHDGEDAGDGVPWQMRDEFARSIRGEPLQSGSKAGRARHSVRAVSGRNNVRCARNDASCHVVEFMCPGTRTCRWRSMAFRAGGLPAQLGGGSPFFCFPGGDLVGRGRLPDSNGLIPTARDDSLAIG